MLHISRRPFLARAGGGAVVLSLAILGGYGIGLTQSPGAAISAAAAPGTGPVDAGGRAIAAPASYAAIVDAVAPAVVTVRVDKRASVVETQLPDDELFRFFGREFQLPRQQQRIPRQSGVGSGVVTSADGYILTNNHVIEGADTVRVELTDKRSFDAKVVGADPASDLAVLKVNATHLPAITLGDSNRVRVGDVVLAIGNPLNVGQTVTMGIISAKGRATGAGSGGYEDFLQTDAPINQGNSGGALINLNGELVGINSQILTPSGGNVGLGFAIPSNQAREVMDQLKSGGQVRRGRLGVAIQEVTPDIAASLQLPDATGALVSAVEPGSPASAAGVKQGDVITAVNGDKVADDNALRNRIAGTRPGAHVTLQVLRGGHSETLHATLGEVERPRTQPAGEESRSKGHDLGPVGMAVEPLTPQIARELGLTKNPSGIVVRDVARDGAAASAGLRPGDVITQVNGQAVKTPAELKSALTEASDRPSLLLVTRERGEIFLTLRRPNS
jgi:Do/DeqQ family serine protease